MRWGGVAVRVGEGGLGREVAPRGVGREAVCVPRVAADRRAWRPGPKGAARPPAREGWCEHRPPVIRDIVRRCLATGVFRPVDLTITRRSKLAGLGPDRGQGLLPGGIGIPNSAMVDRWIRPVEPD